MKIATKALQSLLSKSIKGVGNNKLFVVTQYITIKATPNDITLLSTDGNNYLYVKENIALEDFNATVQADTFNALISKMTCDEIELIFNNDILTVKGNGDYQIPTLNENGITEIQNPFKDVSFEKNTSVNTKELKKYLMIAKPSLSVVLEQPCYTGYYFGDKLTTTDSYQITIINKNVLNNNVLLYNTTAELLNLMSEDNIDVAMSDNELKFQTDNITIYTKQLSGKEDYKIDAINSIADSKFTNTCTINKNEMIAALNRLSLFVSPFDKNAIKITFDKNSLTITTKGTNGKEAIAYVTSNVQDDEYEIIIDIKLLQAQLAVMENEEIVLNYHDEQNRVIKFDNGDIIQMIALMVK